MLIVDRYWYLPKNSAGVRCLSPIPPKKASRKRNRRCKSRLRRSPPPHRGCSSRLTSSSPNRCASRLSSTSPSGDFERAASCSPPPPDMRQTVPTQNKGIICRQNPRDENPAWHWALRGGVCNKFGDPMLEGFTKSESSRSRSMKSCTPPVTAPEKQSSSRRRSPAPDNSGDEAPKGIVLLPAGDAEKRSQLRRAIRTRLAECDTSDDLQAMSQDVLHMILHGRADIPTTKNSLLDFLREARWVYQPDVVQQVWRNAVHQVAEQEIHRRRRSLRLVRRDSGVKEHRVSVKPVLHRSPTSKSNKSRESHQSLDPDVRRESDGAQLQKEKSWKTSFGRLSCGAKLRVEDVPRALELCGIMCPQARFIEEVLARVTRSQTLSCEEFIRLIQFYLERQRLEYGYVFQKFDVDGSETIEKGELGEVLKSFGIEPLQYVLDDLVSEIDENGSGRLELKEFIEFLELFEFNEGFSGKERKQFEAFFSRLDQNDDGLISANLLGGALGWLGCSLQEEDVAAITQKMDVDSTGNLDWNEFLRCMRKVREKEIEILKEALVEFDKDRSNSIGFEELEALLASLGMMCDQEAVIHAAEDSGSDLQDMDLNDLWKFIHLYRAREGLSRDECAEVDIAFDRYDSDQREEINVVDIGKALRWFGYQVSFEVQQQLTGLVDVDRSGRLNKQEFRKLIRLYWEGELKRMREVFEKATAGNSTLSLEQTAAAFRRLDFLDEARKTPSVPNDCAMGVDLSTFMSIGIQHKKAMRDVFRQNGGYTQQETVHMQFVFDEYDTDRSDSIGTNELGVLIQSIFPVMNLSVRSKLDLLMKEIDADGPGTGKLSFEDFLRTMRQFHDIQHQERAEKEHRIVEETNFTPQEVQGFRDIFLMCDTDFDQQLTTAEIKKMIQNVCPLGNRNSDILDGLIEEVRTQEKVKIKGGFDVFDFPEFLLLMRKMLDVNFAGLKERLSIVL